jgi:hypothetical protein
MICANCKTKIGQFISMPRSPTWKDCRVEPIRPTAKLVPGSTQICAHCGQYILLPSGGVLTDKGELEDVIKRNQTQKQPERREGKKIESKRTH